MSLDAQEKIRYSRQIAMFGEEGQERLKSARVMIAGAGGLGSVIAGYLGLAGIGFIRIADSDQVDMSNLNRHILASLKDVGREKTSASLERLAASCPSCRVEALHRVIDSETVQALTSDVDIIVDALDNHPSRHMLNRAAVEHGIPLVHGAVRGLYGQALTVIPRRGACLRCILAEDSPREDFPILGPTCGVIGSVQAGEVVKFITGLGTLLVDRLFVWNGSLSEAEIVEVRKNPSCTVCGNEGRGSA
jgi:molybdopterin-synthase adenylyltransferase